MNLMSPSLIYANHEGLFARRRKVMWTHFLIAALLPWALFAQSDAPLELAPAQKMYSLHYYKRSAQLAQKIAGYAQACGKDTLLAHSQLLISLSLLMDGGEKERSSQLLDSIEAYYERSGHALIGAKCRLIRSIEQEKKSGYPEALDNCKKGLYLLDNKRISAQETRSYLYFQAGCLYRQMRIPDSALTYILKALHHAPPNHHLQSHIYKQLFHIHHFFEHYEEATDALQQALQLASDHRDSFMMAQCLMSLSDMEIAFGDATKSYDYYAQASILYQLHPAEWANETLYFRYCHLAKFFRSFQETDSSLYYLKKAMSCPNAQDPYYAGYLWNQIGTCYIWKHLPDSSEMAFLNAIHFLTPLTAKTAACLAEAYYGQAKILMEARKWSEAKPILKKSLAICSTNHVLYWKIFLYKDIATVFEHLHQPDSALFYFKQYDILAEKQIQAATKVRQYLKLRYRAEQKDKEIAHKSIEIIKNREQKEIFLLLLAIAIILLLSAALYHHNRILALKKAALNAYEESRHKTQELRAFNYMVSHDLKSPLNNAERLLDLLHVQFPSDTDHLKEPLAQFSQIVCEMKQMIGGIADYAQADNIELHIQEININLIIASIVQRIQEAEPARNFQFDISTLPPLYGDPLMLRQVFTNLLTNAAKFTSKKTHAHIQVSGRQMDDGFTEIIVADNGAGIAPVRMHRIFYLFKTAHDRRQFKGVGAGLAIVKRIVERHGGAIRAESKGLGKGAAFVLRMPSRAKHA